uniref:DUF4114 domain-containing protein n=1 Tax=Eiseniibacteriota bacterium TaxID=2212470 RepID=A0A832I606_UNCEI
MEISRRFLAMAAVASTICLAPPAGAAVPVAFGSSWDGPSYGLQALVNALYGAGRINVATDYLGARPGDPDPWFWVDHEVSSLLVREVAGNASRNTVGWYEETYAPPIIDGVGDGVIFDGPSGEGAEAVVTFDRPMTRFGFWLDPNGALDAPNAPQPERFFTNRHYNDRGPDGSGALHAPWDGDVQALVFDISHIKGVPNTWLVCFEDLDSGPHPAPCCTGTDNDFNDVLFEVHAFGATPARPLSLADLKRRYR